MRTMIVYVHGLWQSGGESIWLRRRLAQDLDADRVEVLDLCPVFVDVAIGLHRHHSQGGRPEGRRVVGVVAGERDGLAGDGRGELDGIAPAAGVGVKGER